MAERNNCKEMLPEKYFSFINENRYDDPIFIVHPILGIEIKPLEGDSKTRVLLMMKGLNKTRKLSHYTNVTDIGLLKFHHRIARI